MVRQRFRHRLVLSIVLAVSTGACSTNRTTVDLLPSTLTLAPDPTSDQVTAYIDQTANSARTRIQVDEASKTYREISGTQRTWKNSSVIATALTGLLAALSNELDLGTAGTIGSVVLGAGATYVANEAGSESRRERAATCKLVAKEGDSVVEAYRNRWKLAALHYPNMNADEKAKFYRELTEDTEQLNAKVREYRAECS